MRTPRVVALAVIAVSALLTSDAHAKDSDFRQQLSIDSYQAGLGRRSVASVETVPGPGREYIATQLLAALHQLPFEKLDDGKRLFLNGPDFGLVVWLDGSRVKYRTAERFPVQAESMLPIDERIPEATLADWGRAFITSTLATNLPLGPNEQVVLWKTTYAVYSWRELPDFSLEQRGVVANSVVFGRVIDGVPVVGLGSRIGIEFSNDGAVLAFEYDWSAIDINEAQQQAVVDDVLGRSVQFNVDFWATSVNRFECGYVDVGTTRRQSALMQPGCLAQIVSHVGPKSGRTTIIPIGDVVHLDPGWPETSGAPVVK